METKLVYRRGRRPRRPAYLHTNRTNIYHVSLRLQRVAEDVDPYNHTNIAPLNSDLSYCH